MVQLRLNHASLYLIEQNGARYVYFNRTGIVLISTIAAIMLSGCSMRADSERSTPATSALPKVSPSNLLNKNPWHSEIQSIRTTSSEFIKELWQDDSISVAEVNKMKDAVSKCVSESSSMRVAWGVDDQFQVIAEGSVSADLMDSIVRKCEKIWDNRSIFLYYKIKRNPSHLPEEVIITQCLIESKIVASNYTVAQYLSDASKKPVPSYLTGEATRNCLSDPLHNLDKSSHS